MEIKFPKKVSSFSSHLEKVKMNRGMKMKQNYFYIVSKLVSENEFL